MAVNRLRVLAGQLVCLGLCGAWAGVAQTPPVVKAFHPDGPMPSYDVATIKPSDPGQQFGGTTLRRYISGAYGVQAGWAIMVGQETFSQVIGGPAWIDKDRYDIKGKPPEDIADAMKKMSPEERAAQNRMMQQSLLAERFHLKVHFETREMPIFELVPAKGGLKITAVDPPPPPSAVPPPPPKPGGAMPPGSARMGIMNGAAVLDARAASMELFLGAIRGLAPDIAGRPIVDMTGFKGNFDVKDFRFQGPSLPQAAGNSGNNADPPDAPSLAHELE
ncbi:MAG TPA: TIGR03435 family protein, partial [Acidobacteriaceae bacterium]|nr:TIGR03435 family protein [Acidobacteriaceae bacterium]